MTTLTLAQYRTLITAERAFDAAHVARQKIEAEITALQSQLGAANVSVAQLYEKTTSLFKEYGVEIRHWDIDDDGNVFYIDAARASSETEPARLAEIEQAAKEIASRPVNRAQRRSQRLKAV